MMERNTNFNARSRMAAALVVGLMAALSLSACAAKQRIVIDHKVINGLDGKAVMQGNTVNDLIPSETVAFFSSPEEPNTTFSIHTPNPNVIGFFHWETYVDGPPQKFTRLAIDKFMEGVGYSIFLDKHILHQQKITTLDTNYQIQLRNDGNTLIDKITLVDALPKDFTLTGIEIFDTQRTLNIVGAILTLGMNEVPEQTKVDFDVLNYEVKNVNGNQVLIINMDMTKNPLQKSGNNSTIILKLIGSVKVPS